MPRCTTCKQEKSESEFYKKGSGKKGNESICKKCKSQKRRDHPPNRLCKICGKPFFARPDALAEGNGLCCSRSCSNRLRYHIPPPVEMTCPVCGKTFLLAVSKAKVRKVHFCSRSCTARSRVKERASNWKGGRLERICEICGKSFLPRRRNDPTKLCSQKCAGILKSMSSRGENHPRWLGGPHIEDYPKTWNKKFKDMIRERDHHTCAVCGKPGRFIHHIDYSKANTVPENCITLCSSCHTKTNADRADWQIFFEGIMKERS